MASKKTSQNDGDGASDAAALESALKEQMPGWKLARTPPLAQSTTDRASRAAKGASVDDLRRKFLGGAGGADAASDLKRKFLGSDDADASDDNAHYPPPDDRRVFRIEPVDGGPPQVAEMRNGKIKLVSG